MDPASLPQDATSLLVWFREYYSREYGVLLAYVTPEADFVHDLGADSFDGVRLVMELEELFDIAISDDAAEEMRTVGEAVALSAPAAADADGLLSHTATHRTEHRMRFPNFAALQQQRLEGDRGCHSYAQGMHPNPLFYKYYWWVFHTG